MDALTKNHAESLLKQMKDSSAVALLDKRAKDSEDTHVPKKKRKAMMSADWGYNYIGSIGFNGEKNAGEVGPIKDYYMDYNGLRARSWQSFIESDIASMVFKKFTEWVIGTGLKIQHEPEMEVLKDYHINFDREKMARKIEAKFRLYCNSRMADYADMNTLAQLQVEAYKNAKVAGDCLVILRWDTVDKCVKVQIVDGAHVQNPPGKGSDLFPIKMENGNRIINGIEIDSKGQHVAFHVRQPSENGAFTMETKRIAARGFRSDALMAYMVYGNKYRIDSHRGLPMLYAVLEKIKKIERYTEAAVGSAEEREKIAYFFEHGVASDGSFPLAAVTAVARDYDGDVASGMVPRDDYGNDLALRVAASTNKKVFNLPQDSTLKVAEGKVDPNFDSFLTPNVKLVAAALDIPYEVMMAIYGSNYSASRAALKQWEQTMGVERFFFAVQFMQPIFAFWMECEVLTKQLAAPGFLRALLFLENRYAIEAFLKARYIGPSVPHIDPEKEVKAERLKLGVAGDAIPLTTAENATEVLSGGDVDSNMEQMARELKTSKSLGIKVEVPPTQAGKPGAKPAKKPTKA